MRSDPALQPQHRVTNADLAARLMRMRGSDTITYAALALEFGVRIADLTDALEVLMQHDALAERPLLAARVVSRARPLPARGFFDKARELGFHCDDDAAFHAAQLSALGKSATTP